MKTRQINSDEKLDCGAIDRLGWTIDPRLWRSIGSSGRSTGGCRDRSAAVGDRPANAPLVARLMSRSFGWNAATDRLRLGSCFCNPVFNAPFDRLEPHDRSAKARVSNAESPPK